MMATLAAVMAFASCQNTSPSEPAAGPLLVTASLPYTEPRNQPDSLTWSVGNGPMQPVTSQEITSNRITGHFVLRENTKDTLYLGLWVAGVRLAKVSFLQT
jgi:hypothetical protein